MATGNVTNALRTSSQPFGAKPRDLLKRAIQNDIFCLFIYLFINSDTEFNTSITQIQGSQQQQYKPEKERGPKTVTQSTISRPVRYNNVCAIPLVV